MSKVLPRRETGAVHACDHSTWKVRWENCKFLRKERGEMEGRRAFRRISIKVLAVVHARNKIVLI